MLCFWCNCVYVCVCGGGGGWGVWLLDYHLGMFKNHLTRVTSTNFLYKTLNVLKH